jgi:CspA family cold shock protein
MSEGTIKKVVSDKGYGFIKSANGSDVFFHCSELRDVAFTDIKTGDKVEFEDDQGPKGARAKNVRVVR